jgi:ribonuclease VapC
MPEVVLDASALLAWMEDEPGASRVGEVLGSGSSVMSAVNWAEVLAKLTDRGVSDEDQRKVRGSLDLEIREFDEVAAHACAALRRSTSRQGLSIGDRACLALARTRGLPVLTADKAWKKLDIGVEVEVIR